MPNPHLSIHPEPSHQHPTGHPRPRPNPRPAPPPRPPPPPRPTRRRHRRLRPRASPVPVTAHHPHHPVALNLPAARPLRRNHPHRRTRPRHPPAGNGQAPSHGPGARGRRARALRRRISRRALDGREYESRAQFWALRRDGDVGAGALDLLYVSFPLFFFGSTYPGPFVRFAKEDTPPPKHPTNSLRTGIGPFLGSFVAVGFYVLVKALEDDMARPHHDADADAAETGVGQRTGSGAGRDGARAERERQRWAAERVLRDLGYEYVGRGGEGAGRASVDYDGGRMV
jgi:hypothetical protein